MRRTPPKSRVRSDKPRVIVHLPRTDQQRYAEPPGYSGHNGGEFHDAGYRTGRGLFGFQQEIT